MNLKTIKKCYSNKHAFTIIELAIVVLISATIISAAAIAYQSTISSSQIKITNNNIDSVYRALNSYLIINRKLPCPASLELINTDTNYGVSVGSDADCSGTGVVVSSVNSNLVYGMVPVKTLGLSSSVAEDGFKTKLSYVVDKRFTKLVNSAGTDGFEGSDGNAAMIEIREVSASTTPAILTNAIMVIISHGDNRLGGFSYASTTQNTTSGITTDETTNIRASNFDSIFVNNSNTVGFDDVLLFKNRIGMAVDAGFESMLCREDDSAYVVSLGSNYGTNKCYDDSAISISLTWASAKYGETVIPKNDSPCPVGCPSTLNSVDYDSNVATSHPLRRCGKYGQWSKVIYPCFKIGTQ
jgi:type II secretory pathway pseudopilin PulG